MRTFLFAVALACLTGIAFGPGIHGGFLFDDFANLPALGAYGPVDNLRTFLLYLTSGKADPTGRPLALLSFLIDARDWPAAALPFKITNILIHALNGCLLFGLVRRLEQRLAAMQAPDRIAFLAAALWALHPLFLSTTLYVVQRETLLAATFMLAGLHLWVSARRRFDAGDARGGWRLALASALGCSFLAILCKANGALLPLLIWIVDSLILRVPAPAGASLRWARRALLMLPAAALLAYLVILIPSAARAAAELRPWTLAERVLSQPGIVLDYLRLLLLPRAVTAGVFQDAAAVPTTLSAAVVAAAAFWLALAAAGFWLRRRQPALALAILFFMAGHLMESTVIPLEPYFEHRNYVPALLLFWPLARWLGGAGAYARWRYAGGLAAVALLALTTHLGARAWGDTYRLAQTWALLAPDSPRAQTFAARQEMGTARYAAAEQRLLRANAARPGEIQVAFALADLYCTTGHYDASVERTVSTALASARNDTRLGFDWLISAIDSPTNGNCPGLDLDGVSRMLAALKSNARLTRSPGRRQDIAYVEGRLALARGDGAAAAEAFNANLRLLARPEVALNQAAMLGNAGFAQAGLAHLDLFRQLYARNYRPWPDMPHVHSWLMQTIHYWDAEIDALRASLAEEAAAKDSKVTP
jgi:protein O-mannosyl-transferase